MSHKKESSLQVITLGKGTPSHLEIATRASRSEKVQALIDVRTKEGYVVDTRDVEVKVVEDEEAATRVLEKAVYPIYRGEMKVGEVGFVQGLEGTQQTIVYAQVEQGNEIGVYYFEDGEILHHTFTEEERQEISAMVSEEDCNRAVTVVCSAGRRFGISGCLSLCAPTGFGTLVCSPVCALLVSFGCTAGGSFICSLV